jgi:hypothetical protein
MKKILTISIGVLFIIGLTNCNATEKQNVPQWRQNLASAIPYKIADTQGVTVQSVEGRHILQAKDRFKLVLTPAEGDVWNMEAVSVLGLMLKNTGPTDLILDLMLGNAGATSWSDSSLGRTIIKPGEEIPLAVALTHRTKPGKKVNPDYLRMSGLPNGHFGHWDTIDSARVKSLIITCNQKGVYACELAEMFPLQKMDESRTGVFPFIDKYGQYILKEWHGKVRSDKDILEGVEIEKKLEKELGTSTGFDQYGGWKEGPKLEAAGFFRFEKYKGKWWFIDPEGYLFWSYGVDCVGIKFAGQTPLERNSSVFQDLPAMDDPQFGQFYVKLDVEHNYALLKDVPHHDFTAANLYRKYGKAWAQKSVDQDIARLKYCHLNTIGAWSDYAVVAQKKVPYTVMLHYIYAFGGEKLPDPFNPESRAGLRKAIQEYPVPFKNDPWCLGAFVDNELRWTNTAREMVANILSYELPNTEVKKVFQGWLKEKYATVAALNEAWKTQFAAWDDLLKITNKSVIKDMSDADCSALAKVYAEAYFKMVKEELNNYSPHLLYLGCRFNVAPREAIETAAKYVDAISANIYSYTPAANRYNIVNKPLLITEFHFVNTGGNNLGCGMYSAQDAVQQGRLFRAYISDVVASPLVVGAHWFQWRDQNVGGRYDGENYNVGFFDVADQPNEDLIRAAEEAGRNLYNSVK